MCTAGIWCAHCVLALHGHGPRMHAPHYAHGPRIRCLPHQSHAMMVLSIAIMVLSMHMEFQDFTLLQFYLLPSTHPPTHPSPCPGSGAGPTEMTLRVAAAGPGPFLALKGPQASSSPDQRQAKRKGRTQVQGLEGGGNRCRVRGGGAAAQAVVMCPIACPGSSLTNFSTCYCPPCCYCLMGGPPFTLGRAV